MKKLLLIVLTVLSLLMFTLSGCSSAESKEDSSAGGSSAGKESASRLEENTSEETGEASPEASETSAEMPSVQKTEEDDETALYFSVKEYKFTVNSSIDEIIAAIGEPMDTFVTSSCAYQGDDYTYYVDGFEVVANTDEEGINRLTSITLVGDTVETPAGLRIGMDKEEALSLMDIEPQINGSVYTFTSGYCMLRVQFGNDDCIKAIQYLLSQR